MPRLPHDLHRVPRTTHRAVLYCKRVSSFITDALGLSSPLEPGLRSPDAARRSAVVGWRRSRSGARNRKPERRTGLGSSSSTCRPDDEFSFFYTRRVIPTRRFGAASPLAHGFSEGPAHLLVRHSHTTICARSDHFYVCACLAMRRDPGAPRAPLLPGRRRSPLSTGARGRARAAAWRPLYGPLGVTCPPPRRRASPGTTRRNRPEATAMRHRPGSCCSSAPPRCKTVESSTTRQRTRHLNV